MTHQGAPQSEAEKDQEIAQLRDRIAELERQPKTGGPRLVGSVSVDGFGTFGPGQEEQFRKAVDAHNSAFEDRRKAKPDAPGATIDLAILEEKGVIQGFGGKAPTPQWTRNRQRPGASEQQTGQDSGRIGDVQNDRAFAIPGGRPLDEMEPRSPSPEEAARRVPGRPVVAGGERAAVEREVTGGRARRASTTPTTSGDASSTATQARRGGASRPARGGAGRTKPS